MWVARKTAYNGRLTQIREFPIYCSINRPIFTDTKYQPPGPTLQNQTTQTTKQHLCQANQPIMSFLPLSSRYYVN